MTNVLVLLLLGSSLFAANEPLEAKLDQHVSAYAKLDRYTGSVLVMRADKVLLRKGFGMGNRSWGIPNDPGTRFRIASITKQFTAAAVLLLEQDGRLKTDDLISQYLPDAPDSWRAITIHNLLTHTSGIKSYTNLPDFADRARRPISKKDMPKLLYPIALEFPVGSKFAYSNSGYFLLGLIIEQVSGVDYEEFLSRRIFKPLGMVDTGYFEHRRAIPRMSEGYLPGGDRPPFFDTSWPYAAGGLYSTVDDLGRWANSLDADALLTEPSKKKMFTAYSRDYGYGWSIERRGGKLVTHHGGGLEGFNTVIERVPEERLTVIALGNQNGPVQQLGNELVEIVQGNAVEAPKARPSIELSANDIRRLTGDFQDESGTLLSVLVRGKELYAKLQRQPEFPLRAETTTLLYVPEVGVDLIVELDEERSTRALLLRQGSKTTRWNRVEKR